MIGPAVWTRYILRSYVYILQRISDIDLDNIVIDNTYFLYERYQDSMEPQIIND